MNQNNMLNNRDESIEERRRRYKNSKTTYEMIDLESKNERSVRSTRSITGERIQDSVRKVSETGLYFPEYSQRKELFTISNYNQGQGFCRTLSQTRSVTWKGSP
jgi:hypothetical protein